MKTEAGTYLSPFGPCFLLFDENILLSMVYADDLDAALTTFRTRFKPESITINHPKAETTGEKIFKSGGKPLFKLTGTPFQLAVWNALLEIPSGQTTTYAQIAASIGKPKAVRATGTAIGNNPIAYMVPCHRVLRADGGIGGYRWGNDLKRMMLASEGVNLPE